MSKSAKIIIAVVIVVLVAGVGVWAATMNKDKDSDNGNNGQNPSSSSENQNSGSSNSNDSTAEEQPIASTVTYTNDGFNVSKPTIKAGEVVRVVNNSSATLDFSSDPHPVHTDNKELNAGDIAPGESSTFTISKKGTWGFHNHLKATHKGSIEVQ